MNLFLLSSILLYFVYNVNNFICLVVYYNNNFCYVYNFNNKYIVDLHCINLFNICLYNNCKIYTYNPSGSIYLLFLLINYSILVTNTVCIKKLKDNKLFLNIYNVIDIENIYNFCFNYMHTVVNKYYFIKNFCCSICSTRILLCLFKTSQPLILCNKFNESINYFKSKLKQIFNVFDLYVYDVFLFINGDFLNFLNFNINDLYKIIFKTFWNFNLFNDFFVVSTLIENFISKLIAKFIGINSLSLMLSKKIFNLNSELSFNLNNVYIINSGVRIKKTNFKYSYVNVLKIDFVSFYSSIYISQYKSFFKEDILNFISMNYITKIYLIKSSNNEKLFKDLLNFFYGYFWHINSFGNIVCYIGEIIMSSFIHYLHDLNIEIIDCNVDHLVIKCNQLNINNLILLCNKFLDICNLNKFFKFSFSFASKAFIFDCNNSVMLIDNNIIGRGIFNYNKYQLYLNENTFNCILKCYYCLDLNFNNFNYLYCIYFELFENYLYIKFFNRKCSIKINDYMYTNKVLCNAISNVNLNICYELLNVFRSNFDIKILVNICRYFLYKFYIFCFPVIFKYQPTSRINKILNFIRLSIFCLDYWIYICSENIKFNMGFNICLAIYCRNLLCLDFDNYKFNNIKHVLENNFLVITSPRNGAKIVGIGSFKYRSKHINLECIVNKWISIYGNYVTDIYNGKYCFYIMNNKLFNFDSFDIKVFNNFFDLLDINYFKQVLKFNNTSNKKIYYKLFYNVFYNLLSNELKNINSYIHSTVFILNNSTITEVKFNIICSGHKNKNYQAFCFLKFFSECGLYVSNFRFLISCSGSNCRVNYRNIRTNIIRFLKDNSLSN